MSRRDAGQLAVAFVFAVLGAVKAVRVLMDEIDDATSRLAWLS